MDTRVWATALTQAVLFPDVEMNIETIAIIIIMGQITSQVFPFT